MSNKFLQIGEVSNLTNAALNVQSVTANNLEPSSTLKTNSTRQIVSSKLTISDVQGLQSKLNTTITTPYDGNMQATDFETPSTTLNALSSLTNNIQTNTQQIQYAPTYVQGTTVIGRLGLFAAGQDPESGEDSPQGQLLCGTVRTTTLSALSGSTLTLSSNLDCQGADVLNAPSITALQQKTEAITRPNSIATAVVGQLLVYEGGDDPSSGHPTRFHLVRDAQC